MKILLFSILVIFAIGLSVLPDAFAEANLSNLELTSKNSILFESSNVNILRTELLATNNDNEEISQYDQNYYLTSAGSIYENANWITLIDYDISSEICPSPPPIFPGTSVDVILCFIIPKNIQENFSLEVTEHDKDYCDGPYGDCTRTSTSIKNPTIMNMDNFMQQNFVKEYSLNLDLRNIELIDQNTFNILKVDFDITNTGNEELDLWGSEIRVFTKDGLIFEPTRYDLTNLGYPSEACDNDTISINPRLTKNYSYCYEVPKNYQVFDMVIKNFDDLSACSNMYIECYESITLISNPKVNSSAYETQENDSDFSSPYSNYTPSSGNVVTNVLGSSVPGCEPNCFSPNVMRINVGDTVTWDNPDSAMHTTTSGNLQESGPDGIWDSELISSGQTYTVEFTYSGTFPYFCMVHPWMTGTVIVSDSETTTTITPEPSPTITPEPSPTTTSSKPSFVDEEKDPWSYISRYNNEPQYKDWFDTNYSEWTIYEAVGLKNPASFVDQDKDPSHYVKRYLNEPTYVDWFNENFPNYKIHEAIGISQNEYMKIVDELTIFSEPTPEPTPVQVAEPEPTPVQVAEPEPVCGQGTVLRNGICVIENQNSEKGGGCLIATAAFGSEMAPQVQFLRELRDNTVLQTTSGTTFMTGFNQFYYSFSPYVADYERENPVFKEAVKVTLTPLLTSLTLLNYVDVDTEEEMLGYGIGIILLNIGMYFVAPAVIIVSLKKRLFI